ncbi:restriction endonuclease subunit S [Tessaracoccus sp. G1721]
MILDLAMRGRLTERQAADEPATALLNRAREAKAALIADGQIRKSKAYGPVGPGDEPYPLPPGWAWCRTVDLIHTVNGRAFKPTDWSSSGLPIIRIQNLNSVAAPYNHFSGSVDEKHLVEPGDLLISWSGTPGTSFGAFVWSGPTGVLNQHIFKCSLFEDYRDFICLAINSRLEVLIDDAHGGVGLQHFTKDKLERLPLAIPPLQEQQRIVQRVGELIDLCDELEQQQAARATARSALTASSLNRFAEVDTAAGVRRAVRSFAENIGLHLATGEGDLAALNRVRQAILDLAIRGRLTRQDTNDEPASQLVARVKASRGALPRRGRQRFAPSPIPGNVDAPFSLPGTWQWNRLGEICESRLGKMLDDRKNTGVPRPYLRNMNVQWGRFNLGDIKEIRLEDDELEEYSLRDGDLLVVEGGEPARCAIWDNSLADGVMVFQKALHRVRPGEGVSARYIALVLRNGVNSGRITELFTGSTIKHLTGEKLKGFLVPLPPTAEQHRIVDRVTELFALCDDLEGQLAAASTLRGDVAASVVAHAASPAPTDNDDDVPLVAEVGTPTR